MLCKFRKNCAWHVNLVVTCDNMNYTCDLSRCLSNVFCPIYLKVMLFGTAMLLWPWTLSFYFQCACVSQKCEHNISNFVLWPSQFSLLGKVSPTTTVQQHYCLFVRSVWCNFSQAVTTNVLFLMLLSTFALRFSHQSWSNWREEQTLTWKCWRRYRTQRKSLTRRMRRKNLQRRRSNLRSPNQRKMVPSRKCEWFFRNLEELGHQSFCLLACEWVKK